MVSGAAGVKVLAPDIEFLVEDEPDGKLVVPGIWGQLVVNMPVPVLIIELVMLKLVSELFGKNCPVF